MSEQDKSKQTFERALQESSCSFWEQKSSGSDGRYSSGNSRGGGLDPAVAWGGGAQSATPQQSEPAAQGIVPPLSPPPSQGQ